VTHDQITDAVRASELLAPSTAIRHDVYPVRSSRRRVMPGQRREEQRVSVPPLSTTASQAPEPANAGQDGGAPGHATCPHGNAWCPGGHCPSCVMDLWAAHPATPDALDWHYKRLNAQPDHPRVADIEFPDPPDDDRPVPRIIPGTRRLA
jgi:hypothetical protein